MSTHLYFQVEMKADAGRRRSRWGHVAQVRLPEDYLLFALLASVRSEQFADLDLVCLTPKGLPDNVSEASLEEGSLLIDDEAARLDLSDCCDRASAAERVASGLSRYIHNESRITHPDFHSYSWATLEELATVLERYQEAGGKGVSVVNAVVAMMRALQSAEQQVRAVFWFE
jgi:hypothetical protein